MFRHFCAIFRVAVDGNPEDYFFILRIEFHVARVQPKFFRSSLTTEKVEQACLKCISPFVS
jgi:hypothetical protein